MKSRLSPARNQTATNRRETRRRLFLMGLAGSLGCTLDRRPRLNIFNWSAYVAPTTIPDFEKEFGVQVRYGIYESNEEMLARVMSGNSGWDVVFPSNYFIRPMVENGLLASLRHEWLPNLHHLEPSYRAPSWDPDLRRCVPYMTGASGIAFSDQLVPSLAAWSDLWSPRLAGRLTMLDDPAEVLGACLKKLGFSINTTSAEILERAKREAIAQKRLLRAYLNAEVRDQLVAGDVLAAQLWATSAQQAIEASPRLRFVYPQEGFARYVDNVVVLRESRRHRLAHQFIDYLLRPEVAAATAAAVWTATPNEGGRELLPDRMRNNPTLYPAPEVLARGEMFEPMPAPAQRLRDRIWTEIKSA